MAYPIAKLLIVLRQKGYNRGDAGNIMESFRIYNQELTERVGLPQEEIANVLEKFINDRLVPLGLNIDERFRIIDLLSEIYGSDDINNFDFIDTEEEGEDTSGLEGQQGGRGGEGRGSQRSSHNESSLNIIGKFMMYGEDGTQKHYTKNDVVYYEGKTFIATEDVSGWVPESMHPDNKWKPVDLADNTIDGEEF